MRLNRFERRVVNQPLRPWLQRWIEAPPLRRIGGRLDGAQVLEFGCGQGEGQRILRRDFGASVVHGIDLDQRQLTRARQRQRSDSSTLAQADVCALPFRDHIFDAAVSFNALHHVPDWQRALREITRVLKPSGRLYLLETLRPFLQAPLMRQLMHHPPDRFGARELQTELKTCGFEVLGARHIPGCFLWTVGQLAAD